MTTPITTAAQAVEECALLPCPFCGGEGELYAEMLVSVLCETCAAEGEVCDSQAEAIAAWNTRAPSPEVIALRAEVARIESERADLWRGKRELSGSNDLLQATIETMRAEEARQGETGSWQRTADWVDNLDMEKFAAAIHGLAPRCEPQGDDDDADATIVKELNTIICFEQQRADSWRGIAAAMGYEPQGHLDVRPTNSWLLARIVRFRALAALQSAPLFVAHATELPSHNALDKPLDPHKSAI